jgi:hypothetical protein
MAVTSRISVLQSGQKSNGMGVDIFQHKRCVTLRNKKSAVRIEKNWMSGRANNGLVEISDYIFRKNPSLSPTLSQSSRGASVPWASTSASCSSQCVRLDNRLEESLPMLLFP